MSRKRLFVGDDDAWTDDAKRLCDEVSQAVKPIVEKYTAMGYRLMDIEYLVTGEVGCILAVNHIRAYGDDMRKRQDEKSQHGT